MKSKVDAFTGTVTKSTVAAGSKSEREAHIIVGNTKNYLLRMKGSNSMDDSSFERYEGKKITVFGSKHGTTFIVNNVVVLIPPTKPKPKPRANKKIKYAVLHFGYVESYGCGSVVLHNKGKPFATEKEAKESLFKDLLTLYKSDNGITDTERACCAANTKKTFCPDCGREIGIRKFGGEDVQEWLEGLLNSTLDSVGGCMFDCEDTVVWEPGHSAEALIGSKKDEVLVLDEQEGRSKKIFEQMGLEE